MGIKNAEFDADFESVEKVAKNPCEKSYQPEKKQKKLEVSTFNTVCKSFWPTTFLWFLCTFLNRFELDIKSFV
jgi:hypothetical protein